jgi:phosphoglycerate dehydrogenase-like enzyme
VVAPRIAIAPERHDFVVEAIEAGGGIVSDIEDAEALVFVGGHGDADALGAILEDAPQIDWVQLPSAGIEAFVAAGLLDDHRIWTCTKGSYAEPVAEHALALALAGLRSLDIRIGAKQWGKEAAVTLYDTEVTILGGGGITEALLGLLQPFRVRATVVRRTSAPLAGAARTLPTARLHEALPGATVVFLALSLTPETRGIIAAPELALMEPHAWLINVARGGHVVTDDLVAALHDGTIGGAGLDVTDPEPLPDGHPLWDAPHCIITPHTADTWAMVQPLMAKRIRENVAHRAAGEPLVGVVDGSSGY